MGYIEEFRAKRFYSETHEYECPIHPILRKQPVQNNLSSNSIYSDIFPYLFFYIDTLKVFKWKSYWFSG